MPNRSQPNAQNSELDPQKHPSGARIEKMMNDHQADVKLNDGNRGRGEKGLYGETLRPSEREDSPLATDEADRGNHRTNPNTRQS